MANHRGLVSLSLSFVRADCAFLDTLSVDSAELLVEYHEATIVNVEHQCIAAFAQRDIFVNPFTPRSIRIELPFNVNLILQSG